ncbi:unnamed protein product [Blepharisma stoltei]|uniref:SCP domain-containing protein n=1 Tax=Blepharisma stoltei TaxID=1481888 RepID=A0AAU9J5F3_9CILI|nr:unnamed protein product [Blepharisma stoltei]
MENFEKIISDAFEYINLARTNPSRFAEIVEGNLENYKTHNLYHREGDVPVITKEGKGPANELIETLRRSRPVKPLKISLGLSKAAQSWANFSWNQNIIGHFTPSSNSLSDRLDPFGKWSECVTEALDYGSLTGYEVIHSFLVDDGIESREHRINFLSGNFKKIGIGCGPHDNTKSVTVILLAGDFIDNPQMPNVEVPSGGIKNNWEVGSWIDGALKLTCDITTDIEDDKLIKTIKRFWEMGDGSSFINEDVIVSDKGDYSGSP